MAARLARIEAIPTVDLGPNGEWPIFGPMQKNGGWQVSYITPKHTSKEWKDDPSAKAAVKTQSQLQKESIDEKLQYWPWRQTVPRRLVTLVSNFFPLT